MSEYAVFIWDLVLKFRANWTVSETAVLGWLCSQSADDRQGIDDTNATFQSILDILPINFEEDAAYNLARMQAEMVDALFLPFQRWTTPFQLRVIEALGSEPQPNLIATKWLLSQGCELPTVILDHFGLRLRESSPGSGGGNNCVVERQIPKKKRGRSFHWSDSDLATMLRLVGSIKPASIAVWVEQNRSELPDSVLKHPLGQAEGARLALDAARKRKNLSRK